ncbi:hypothetical protein AAVH_39637 [Aphelenchoides avenae]|nr:hypothetical protein AAVH_39637 [Aphelenchus avenae]
MHLVTVWPEAYTDHPPCGACTKVHEPEEDKTKRLFGHRQPNSVKKGRFVVEKFHFPSKHFDKKLTVELHFTLHDRHAPSGVAPDRTATAPSLAKCHLLPNSDFAPEVYGFLDRVHVGASLLANSDLSKLIVKLTNYLPLRRLTCDFEMLPEGLSRVAHFSGIYLMTLRHYSRDHPYSDMRQFQVPSAAGSAADCALLCRYLSNSHVLDFMTPQCDSRFAFKMLAALADRNFSVGALRMNVDQCGLSDYRCMDTVSTTGCDWTLSS